MQSPGSHFIFLSLEIEILCILVLKKNHYTTTHRCENNVTKLNRLNMNISM